MSLWIVWIVTLTIPALLIYGAYHSRNAGNIMTGHWAETAGYLLTFFGCFGTMFTRFDGWCWLPVAGAVAALIFVPKCREAL